MNAKKLNNWSYQSKNKNILLSFVSPQTPTQVKNKIGINKFNLKPFKKRGLLKCLTPDSKKGKLYVLTNKARSILGLPHKRKDPKIDYALIGWILSSPRQRYVVLQTLSKNVKKLTSESIRNKSKHLNECLSRISTKSILKDLIMAGLVETEMGEDRRRYYWATEKGRLLLAITLNTYNCSL